LQLAFITLQQLRRVISMGIDQIVIFCLGDNFIQPVRQLPLKRLATLSAAAIRANGANTGLIAAQYPPLPLQIRPAFLFFAHKSNTLQSNQLSMAVSCLLHLLNEPVIYKQVNPLLQKIKPPIKSKCQNSNRLAWFFQTGRRAPGFNSNH
jgi:hypothetical protein